MIGIAKQSVELALETIEQLSAISSGKHFQCIRSFLAGDRVWITQGENRLPHKVRVTLSTDAFKPSNAAESENARGVAKQLNEAPVANLLLTPNEAHEVGDGLRKSVELRQHLLGAARKVESIPRKLDHGPGQLAVICDVLYQRASPCSCVAATRPSRSREESARAEAADDLRLPCMGVFDSV